MLTFEACREIVVHRSFVLAMSICVVLSLSGLGITGWINRPVCRAVWSEVQNIKQFCLMLCVTNSIRHNHRLTILCWKGYALKTRNKIIAVLIIRTGVQSIRFFIWMICSISIRLSLPLRIVCTKRCLHKNTHEIKEFSKVAPEKAKKQSQDWTWLCR